MFIVDPPQKIECDKVIIVEGADAGHFLDSLLRRWNKPTIQIFNFGGVNDLKRYMKTFVNTPGFDKIAALGIIRDAETSSKSAVDSIKGSLRSVGLPIPNGPREISGGKPKIIYYLFPDVTQGVNGELSPNSGTLGDLCLQAVEDDAIMNCVDEYLGCLASKIGAISRRHKVKLYSYLAGKDGMTGKKSVKLLQPELGMTCTSALGADPSGRRRDPIISMDWS